MASRPAAPARPPSLPSGGASAACTPNQVRRCAAMTSGLARRVAIRVSAVRARAATAIACAWKACLVRSRSRAGSRGVIPLMGRAGGAGAFEPVEVRLGVLASQQRGHVPQHAAGHAQQVPIDLRGPAQIQVAVQGVADQRGAPLQQLNDAGQRLVRGGQPGRPVGRGGELGHQLVLGRAGGLQEGRSRLVARRRRQVVGQRGGDRQRRRPAAGPPASSGTAAARPPCSRPRPATSPPAGTGWCPSRWAWPPGARRRAGRR